MLSYPTRTAMVRNILREYRRTDAPTRHEGRMWYRTAYRLAYGMTVDSSTPVTVSQVIGIIAAISPKTQWWQNVMLAKQVLQAGVMVQGHTSDTMTKVNRILAGEAPLEVLGGKKVRSFYLNIESQGIDPTVVTIDRHAWRTVCGRHELADRNSVPAAGYDLARDAFTRAAEILTRQGAPITPAELQAVVWVPRAA